MSEQKLGVLMVGLGGGIATTVVGGAALMRKGLADRVGMLTETGRIKVGGKVVSIKDHLGLTPLEDIVFGGWDINDNNLFESAVAAEIIRKDNLEKVREELEAIRPVPAVFSQKVVKNIDGTHVQHAQTAMDAAERVREQIRDYRKRLGTDRLVIVNVASTEPLAAENAGAVLQDPDAFVAGLKASDRAISPAMIYFYAGIMEGVPHVNFTPSPAEVPALRQLAEEKKVLYCGQDGKTGQTFLKTVLAPGFKGRQWLVDGWFSTNILGNKDGKVLADPDSLNAKLKTKGAALDSILGYKVGAKYDASSHVVSIHYYPPRGDAKEAWDNIDIVGFLGTRMQIKVNFLCRDSILAAPLVLDLARLVRHGTEKGKYGIFKAASGFFKSPLHTEDSPAVHDFFQQQLLLGEYMLGGKRGDDPFFELW